MFSSQLALQGYALIPMVLTPIECASIANHLAAMAMPSVGTRNLLQKPWCQALAAQLRRNLALVPPAFVAVQCTYFEKSVSHNWLVPVHQDLGIPVAARVAHSSLRAWSEKEGSLFVQPPITLLEELIALRVHIDACTAQDGPLRVVPGSHLLGQIAPESAAAMRRTSAEFVCEAASGSVLAMRPLLLHSSAKSTGVQMRRVLHFVFGPKTLPLGLKWQIAV